MVGHRIVRGAARRDGFFLFGRRTVTRVRAVRQPRETGRSAASRRRLRGYFQRTPVALLPVELCNNTYRRKPLNRIIIIITTSTTLCHRRSASYRRRRITRAILLSGVQKSRRARTPVAPSPHPQRVVYAFYTYTSVSSAQVYRPSLVAGKST